MAEPDPLAAAKRLLGSDPAAAARLAQEALRRAPSPHAALLLATARRRGGDHAGARQLLAPLAISAPRAWGVQFELGMALACAGEGNAALAAFDRALALNPGAALARHARGDLAALAGRPVLPEPLDDPMLRQTALAFLDGSPHAAEALSARFGLDRHDVAALCLLADLGIRFGRYDAATDLLAQALRLAPLYRPAQFRLAEALYRAERDDEALAPIETLVAACPDAPGPLALQGAILMRLGRVEEAADSLRKVEAATPADARAALVHGHALRALGRRDDARAAYRRAIAIEPDFGEAYWSMADMKAGSFAKEELVAMRALLVEERTPPATRSHLDFALGRACEDAGDHAQAFAHYARANAVRRAVEPYDIAAHEAFVARMIDVLDSDLFAARSGWGAPSAAPIFILGMPRAGSSLIEQILASHSQVEGLSELPLVTLAARSIAGYPEALATLPADAFAAHGRDYLARTSVRRLTDRPHAIDKFPGNAFHVGLIRLMLPGARIIDARRDARDCCVSLFAQSFAAGQGYSYELTDLARYYASYVRLMRHIDTVLPGHVLRVDYEALVDDLAGQTRRILDHCGLPFEEQCLRFFANDRAVRTASSEQVRQPIYRGSVGRWQRFEPWLTPLLETLALHGVVGPVTQR